MSLQVYQSLVYVKVSYDFLSISMLLLSNSHDMFSLVLKAKYLCKVVLKFSSCFGFLHDVFGLQVCIVIVKTMYDIVIVKTMYDLHMHK